MTGAKMNKTSALASTVHALLAPGKGLLAADESFPTIGKRFDELGIPAPDYHLGIGTASHAVQTARIMEAFEPVLLEVRPDWVLVVGDVNSTMAAALVAVKLKEQTGVQICHQDRASGERQRALTPSGIDCVLVDS